MQYDDPLLNYIAHVRGILRNGEVDFVVAEEYRKRVVFYMKYNPVFLIKKIIQWIRLMIILADHLIHPDW